VATSGTADSGTYSTLTDIGAGWTVDAFQDGTIHITAGRGAGQVRTISSNTADTVTVTQYWSIWPNATSQYTIYDYDGSGYGVVNITQNGVNMVVAAIDTLANRRFRVLGLVTPKCFAGTDSDGDGYCQGDMDVFFDGNALRHSEWPAWLTTSLDTDGGGADIGYDGVPEGGFDSDWLETYLGNDPARPCADTYGAANANDETVDNWMFDFNDDGKPALGDVLQYISRVNRPADTPELRRFDFNVDVFISLVDALKFIEIFHIRCGPRPPQQ
jgi:hypothetical protein